MVKLQDKITLVAWISCRWNSTLASQADPSPENKLTLVLDSNRYLFHSKWVKIFGSWLLSLNFKKIKKHNSKNVIPEHYKSTSKYRKTRKISTNSSIHQLRYNLPWFLLSWVGVCMPLPGRPAAQSPALYSQPPPS